MSAASSTGPLTACHVVAVPYPGRGHVNPMMNLCKLLANSNPDLLITVVVTEEWLGFIHSDEKPPSVHFATIANVLPAERDRADYMPSFVGATRTKMGEPFERLLDRLEPPVNFIIANTFLNWAVDLCSFELSERGHERVDYIPGLTPIRLADTPSIAHMKDQTLLRLALRVFPNVSKAHCLLISSIYELESEVIEALKQKFPFPVYTFSPPIPHFNLEKVTSFSTNQSGDHHYFEWLTTQPPSSVLYISLGSFLSVSYAQMDEMADGLCGSGVRFFWVARGEATRLQERCGDAGKVVPWCDQTKSVEPSFGWWVSDALWMELDHGSDFFWGAGCLFSHNDGSDDCA